MAILLTQLRYWAYLYGTVFQQYFDDEAQSTFWVSCGHGEKSVITVWFEDESNEWRLSTDNKKSLKEFVPQVKALLVDRADIKLKLKFIK